MDFLLKHYLENKERGTKSNPYTMHFLIRALMDANNTSNKVKVSTNVARKRNNKTEKGRSTYGIHITWEGKEYVLKGIRNIKGGARVFMTEEKVDIPYEEMHKFENQYTYRYKSILEYPITATDAGTYKDCLGGGWYEEVPMYEFEGKYYAAIECSSTMNELFREYNKL